MSSKERNFEIAYLIEKHMNGNSNDVAFKYRGVLCFDHLFAYTQSFDKPAGMVCDHDAITDTALWLSSYLAHWGMFRGSSKLKETNIVFFKDLVTELLHSKTGILNTIAHLQFHELATVDAVVLDNIFHRIATVLQKVNVTPTGTLLSKVILGLTHNVPGYDRYFVAGIKQLQSEGRIDRRVGPKLTGKNVIALSEWYAERDWPVVKSPVNGLPLPSGRLVDMVLNQYGRDNAA
ncbi:hypothetical protein [Herbaspirillum sp. SJZ107]|uniref:hypothetical protein n=1 Tax=Herbaspirillum sp. SJZ107 TaxID=2572881 RepID=UPI001152F3E4|nr:hypothetical protein [Herbaspirillum sp. SJZ107]TQK06956.1 hypothetical protein FBX97_2221 [Herbaspirillum sp. SJZ107]